MYKMCPDCSTRFDDPAKMRCPHDGAKLIICRDDSIAAGELLDERYEVGEKLGEGGMGTVYLAKQIAVDRNVAIKVLKGDYTSDVDLIKRFFREAKAAAALTPELLTCPSVEC